MKIRNSMLLLAAIPVLSGVVLVSAQDDDVRGAFMTTRPRASEARKSQTKPTHRRPKATPSPTPRPLIGGGETTGTTIKRPRLGLGLTLFMRDSTGLAVRTDPTREFHKGDHVRVLLETNADGYLYVFNTTDDGPPVMIYPDPELDQGGNYIEAHVPFEIPSSTAAEERLRWFTFDQNAGAEKLYFVFSREPLTGVPIEDDLLSLCRNDKSKCPWHPSSEAWLAMQKQSAEPVQAAKGKIEGAQSMAERDATARGIGLNRDDPEPSLIVLSASTNKSVLVATLQLAHGG
ncbi:MAG TPA: DUF4384 domain-containing protein [Pyrinomonadaceae bacterium]|nr:DUF4384 domain-containing protein [Pyrinomonadaceae bacterium]